MVALSPVFWHIWGRPVWALSSGLRYKLFTHYVAGAKRVGCVFTTRGDLSFLPNRTQRCRATAVLPTRMDPSLNTMANDRQREGKMTVGGAQRPQQWYQCCTRSSAIWRYGKSGGDEPPNNEAYIEEVRRGWVIQRRKSTNSERKLELTPIWRYFVSAILVTLFLPPAGHWYAVLTDSGGHSLCA